MSQLQFVGLSSAKASANAAADVNDKVTALFPEQDDEAVGTALELFNQMSRQITDSYRTLESRVNQLSGELSAESQQRQAELEQKEELADRLSTLLHALPAGVVVLDSQGVVTQTNPAAITLLGEPLGGWMLSVAVLRPAATMATKCHSRMAVVSVLKFVPWKTSRGS